MYSRSECEAVVRELWPYLDGRVADDKRDLIVRHLERCDRCRSHFDYAAEFLKVVAASEPDLRIDIPTLEERVLHAIAADA